MADANWYRNLIESGDVAVAAAVIVSPLLNLAQSRPSGATVNQTQPLMPLGASGLTGSAMLSLAPDRKTIEVYVHLDRGGAPTAIQLRRLASHHLGGGTGSYDYDLLVAEVVSALPAASPFRLEESFQLSDRGSFPRFERVSDLRKLGIDLSALTASSIDGLRVEAAQEAKGTEPSAAGYLAERMYSEIKAAERSAGAAAACKHLELANLYARRLGCARPDAAS